jgi:hypothetical protein
MVAGWLVWPDQGIPGFHDDNGKVPKARTSDADASKAALCVPVEVAWDLGEVRCD